MSEPSPPPAYSFTIDQTPDGTDLAECHWSGQTFRAEGRTGVEMALARKLVAAGAPDGRWASFWPSGLPSMRGPSIARLATLAVAETDRDGLVVRRYVPHPGPQRFAAAAD